MFKSFKPNLGNNLITLAFGLLILSAMPAILGTSFFITQQSFAQPEVGTSPADSTDATASPNLLSPGGDGQSQLPTQNGFSVRILATNFSAPHNILYGIDGALWITERLGKNITRVDPSNGSKLSTMEVPDVWQSEGQDGLMGMAFDPDFNNTNYIYVAYTYAGEVGDDIDRRAKITRFTYDPTTSTIGEPFDLISGLHASVDHNSGRMTFGPDGMLYYTIGDQGNNQLSRYCFDIQAQELPTAEEVAAQNWGSYQGKVLRMNPDGSIPEDNPEINGVRSHIFTYGHRNPQGLEVGPNGDLYVAEHGPSADDEVSRLQAGGNYGWPYVSGLQDGQAYQYVNWSAAENCEQLEYDNLPPHPPQLPVMNENEFEAENHVAPVYTFYTVPNDYNFTDHDCEIAYICNPTVAPSSLDLVTSDVIPDWNGTFLMTTLKAGRIFQLTLNEEGTALAQEPVELFRSENRYRDLAFDPDGRTLYVITDSFGPAQNIEGGSTTQLWTPGSLIAFTYEGGGNSTTTTGQ